MKIHSKQSYLKLEFEDRTKKLVKVTATLMKDYSNNTPNSLIIWFENQIIKVNLSKHSPTFSIPINHNLANEIFRTIELQGPSAYVILFTYSNGDDWNYFNSLQYTDKQIFESTQISFSPNISKVLQKSMSSGLWQYPLLAILILIFLINCIALILLRNYSNPGKYEMTATNEELNTCEDSL